MKVSMQVMHMRLHFLMTHLFPWFLNKISCLYGSVYHLGNQQNGVCQSTNWSVCVSFNNNSTVMIEINHLELVIYINHVEPVIHINQWSCQNTMPVIYINHPRDVHKTKDCRFYLQLALIHSDIMVFPIHSVYWFP